MSDSESSTKPISSAASIFNLIASIAFAILVVVLYGFSLKLTVVGILTGLLAYAGARFAFGNRLLHSTEGSVRQTIVIAIGAMLVFLVLSLLVSWIDQEFLLVAAILQSIWLPIAVVTFVVSASIDGLLRQ